MRNISEPLISIVTLEQRKRLPTLRGQTLWTKVKRRSHVVRELNVRRSNSFGVVTGAKLSIVCIVEHGNPNMVSNG